MIDQVVNSNWTIKENPWFTLFYKIHSNKISHESSVNFKIHKTNFRIVVNFVARRLTCIFNRIFVASSRVVWPVLLGEKRRMTCTQRMNREKLEVRFPDPSRMCVRTSAVRQWQIASQIINPRRGAPCLPGVVVKYC